MTLNTEVDWQSINSQHYPDYSNHRSRPQTPSILLTSPESDLVDADPPSPVEDFQTYAQFMIHMAKSLNPQIHHPSTEPADHLFDPISKDATTPVHISMLPSLFSTTQWSWTKPASSHTMSKRNDNLCRVHDPGALFLQKQPAPNSIFVEASQSRSRHQQTLMTPNKDSRRIDSMGKMALFISSVHHACC